jgi:low molecular weight phosphotyrosine protein phosphatase
MAEAVFRSLTNNLLPTSESPSSRPLSRTSTTTPISSAAAPHPQISTIDSAGTGAYHILEPPDPRTMSTLHTHNINGYTHAARKITAEDFGKFDYILAMDRANLSDLKAMKGRVDRKAGVSSRSKVRLFGEFGGNARAGGKRAGGVALGEEVVDPYYGVDDGFEAVYEQVERFGRAFLRDLVEKKANEAVMVDGELS